MSDHMISDPVLTAVEVAADLRISKSQAHKLMRGEVDGIPALPHLAVGRRRVVPRSVLERWKQESVSDMLPDHSEKNIVGAR